MRVLGTLAATLGCASAASFQKLLVPQQDQQAPLAAPSSTENALLGDDGDDKPLVDSEELQSKIHKDNLLARAKELYEIAKLSEDEYNHPTRVIGSPGKYNWSRRRCLIITITIT